MDLGLSNATVVVAGGTTGMGRAAARCFAEDGARVAILARSKEGLEETAEALTALGSPDAVGIPTDLFDTASVNAAIEQIRERWGTSTPWSMPVARCMVASRPSRPTPTRSGRRLQWAHPGRRAHGSSGLPLLRSPTGPAS